MIKLSEDLRQNNAVKVKMSNLIDYVKVDVFTAKEVETAAAKVFMRRKSRKYLRMKSFTWSSTSSSIEEAVKIISGSWESSKILSEDALIGKVIDRIDLIASDECDDSGEEMVTRKTSLVKIDLESCGNPPYQPGDHVQVFPRNVVSIEKLQFFLGHLAGDDLSLDSHMHVSFDSKDTSRMELAVAFPLLSKNLDRMISLGYFFEKQVAMLAPISMQACQELADLAPDGKDKKILHGLSLSANEYERMSSLTGMKWFDLFKVSSS